MQDNQAAVEFSRRLVVDPSGFEVLAVGTPWAMLIK